MKSPQSSVRLRHRATKAARRTRLLAKFESSSLSAAAFAQVELAPNEPTYLTVEVGTLARVRLT
jgi:hypothetical protein